MQKLICISYIIYIYIKKILYYFLNLMSKKDASNYGSYIKIVY